jgi:uncharacterized membrane protein YfcA
MKSLIYLGVLIFSTIGAWLGAALDHGNWFGGLGILGTAIGSFFGIWVVIKIANYF